VVDDRPRHAHHHCCARPAGRTRTRTSARTASPSIRPHADGRQDAEVTPEGLRFNAPLLHGRGDPDAGSLFSSDAPGLLIDTVKRAEDGDDLIVRLYEAHGGRGTARLRVGVPFAGAYRANLLEVRLTPAEGDGTDVLVLFRPFEIVTLALGAPG